MDISNPFKFKSIRNMIDAEFDTIGPCVVMASPGQPFTTMIYAVAIVFTLALIDMVMFRFYAIRCESTIV
jgi:hypothetical protein